MKKINSLGNHIVLDLPKKNLPLLKKLEYLKESNLDSTQELQSDEISYSFIKKRDIKLKQKLVRFFQGDV
jgi:hypothetical protein